MLNIPEFCEPLEIKHSGNRYTVEIDKRCKLGLPSPFSPPPTPDPADSPAHHC